MANFLNLMSKIKTTTNENSQIAKINEAGLDAER